MNPLDRPRWFQVVLLAGAAYLAIGLAGATLAASAAPNHAVLVPRLAAWVLSAAVFGAHIVYEHRRLPTSAKLAALHASASVAIGAFGLAAAASVHSTTAPARPHFPIFALAVWPIMLSIPAFIAAWALAAALGRTRR